MQVRLEQLAEMVGASLEGDPNALIDKATPLHTADETSVSFAERPDRVDWGTATKAKAIVVSKDSNVELPKCFDILRVDNPKVAFEKIASFFRPRRELLIPKGVSPSASIAPTAKIGCDVSIAPFAVIGDDVVIEDGATVHSGVVLMPGVKIGKNTTLFPNVVIYEDCEVGANCILHANCVIGAYGFGYDSSTGVHILAAQYGNVVIEDDVEIGACSTIDRGAYDSTRIGAGTKIDNQVMIAHNCSVGKRNLVCASTGVAGSVSTGDYVVMAGRVGVRDHISIGTGALIGAMAGVMGSVPAGAKIVGIPATPEKEQMRKQVALAKLPEMQKQFKALQKEVEELKQKIMDSIES